MTPEQRKGQGGACETVKIKAEGGYAVINAADFDPKVHVKYGEPAFDDGAAEEQPAKQPVKQLAKQPAEQPAAKQPKRRGSR